MNEVAKVLTDRATADECAQAWRDCMRSSACNTSDAVVGAYQALRITVEARELDERRFLERQGDLVLERVPDGLVSRDDNGHWLDDAPEEKPTRRMYVGAWIDVPEDRVPGALHFARQHAELLEIDYVDDPEEED
jgi:hypothetical protein